jgi:hypothetical protein
MSVRRPSKSRAVIATPNMRHKPKEQASGKTLTGAAIGIGEKAKRNVSGRRRARFDREVIGAF